jgi:hypothetical protein
MLRTHGHDWPRSDFDSAEGNNNAKGLVLTTGAPSGSVGVLKTTFIRNHGIAGFTAEATPAK